MFITRIPGILITFLLISFSIASAAPPYEPDEQQLLTGKPFIYKLKAEEPHGRGYKLIYVVDAPLDIFWQFKTDFDNDFLVSNKRISIHRFIGRSGNVVITENKYTNISKALFRWQITVVSDQHRLEFVLLNPEESDHEYHFGYIQLESLGLKTKVTQVAYFDFFGDFLWVNYPFYGGMSDFLKYNARWEQQAILKQMHRYQPQDNQ
jgi:hypothetical protein